jgi:hypothetical protein
MNCIFSVDNSSGIDRISPINSTPCKSDKEEISPIPFMT